MARFNFCDGDYTSQSITADCQLTNNWYPELLESGQGKSQIALYPTPGLSIFSALPETCRLNGSFAINGRMFQAAGSHLYEIFSNGTYIARFAIANDSKPVSIAAAQVIAGQGTPQLAIVSAGSLYVMNLLTNTVTIPPGLVGTPLQIVYVDGYYILLNTNGEFQFSTGLDATTWPGIETEATTSYPDQTIGIASVHRQLFTLGQLKGTTYYNAGDQPIPFDEVSGGDFEQGTLSAWSLVPLDNTLFFIGQNKEGAAIAWRLSGYTPVRISTHGIEYAWQGYTTISDVVCYGYQDQGHTFYVCYFPTANVTWVYDVATQKWHRRSFWNATTGQKTAHRSCSHAYCFGQHLVGDWASGNVYSMSIAQTMDFGNLIQRNRRATHLSIEDERIFYYSLQVIAESGLTPTQTLPGTATPTIFNIQDSASAYWNVGINDLGRFTTTPAANINTGSLFLNDSGNTSSWQITVIPVTGGVDVVPVPYNPGFPTYYMMYSNTGTSQWRINVLKVSSTLGNLQASFVATVYRNPTMMLRWSDDAGHTWSNWHPADTGAPGAYKSRVKWRRLGHARDRVFEVQASDPIPWRLIDAYLKSSNDEVTERLTDRARKMA